MTRNNPFGFLVALAAVMCSFARAETEPFPSAEAREILQRIESGCVSNFEKIETWTGAARFESAFIYRGTEPIIQGFNPPIDALPIKGVTITEVIFHAEPQNGKVQWRYVTDGAEFISTKTNENFGRAVGTRRENRGEYINTTRYIHWDQPERPGKPDFRALDPTNYFQWKRPRLASASSKPVLIVERRSVAESQGRLDLSPVDVLCGFTDPENMKRTLKNYLALESTADARVFEEVNDGARFFSVEFELKISETASVLMTKTYSEAVSFNLVRSTITNRDQGGERVTIEWTNKAGVMIPISARRETFSPGKFGQEPFMWRSVTFEKSEINTPPPPDLFAPVGLFPEP